MNIQVFYTFLWGFWGSTADAIGGPQNAMFPTMIA
jgi:hypothetical protein